MRIINSPGVQITEKDLSLRTNAPVGTNIVVPGFAPQGPVSEPLFITSTSELEQIYGTPTTPAERYFYYSCKEILNSPGTLTTVRLPYGSGNGSGFSNAYSALFYPMASATDGWTIGKPQHWNLTPQQYSQLLENNFDWAYPSSVTTPVTSNVSVLSSVTYTLANSAQGLAFAIENDVDGQNVSFNLSGSDITFSFQLTSNVVSQTVSYSTTPFTSSGNFEFDTIGAGFIVLNDLQTTVNELAEGYYVGFADNSAFDQVSSPDFESITTLQTLTGNRQLALVDSDRVDFALSATNVESAAGITSVSESLEKVGFAGFEGVEYNDHLSFGIFKIRRSTSDATLLTLATTEKYLGSFDYNRKQISPAGGILANAFIEDIINESSPTIKLLINPQVSKLHDWTVNSNIPTSSLTVSNDAKSLFPLGVYTTEGVTLSATKEIGNVPQKLDKALRTLEIVENTDVDVVVDAGLSTIYSVTKTLSTGTFNDETYVDGVSSIEDGWRSVATTFVNFAENVRKDCVAVIDVPRSLLVSGKDTKVIDAEGKTFTQHIYNPLKELATINSNYATMYGNWVKVQDLFSNRRMWLPFSGYAAAIYARNDSVAASWSAPAGLNRGTFNVDDIAFNPNQKQRDRLYELSVNPVVFFTGDGFAVMGQKTSQIKPTAFDRINVRRLFLTLERAVQKTLKYFVFEPNTEFTRTRLKNTITPIFELAKNTEGLYDYLIVADERNNTPDVIDNNELVVDIYIKPVRTAEFILVNFIATRTSQNFQELI